MGVISTFFRLSEYLLLNRGLLKFLYNIYEQITLFSFEVWTEISNCCVTLFELIFSISLKIFSLVLNLQKKRQFLITHSVF